MKKCLIECCHIIFPSNCLHCKEKSPSNFFCDSCLSFFDLLEKKDIRHYPSLPCKVIPAFEDFGPITTFFVELKRMALPSFAKVAASYMICQYFNFEKNFPDIVIPLSENCSGVKYVDIISKEIANLIGRPIKKMFFSANFPFLPNFSFVKKASLQEKTVLLVTGKVDEKKVKEAIELLQKNNFKEIILLAFSQ